MIKLNFKVWEAKRLVGLKARQDDVKPTKLVDL